MQHMILFMKEQMVVKSMQRKVHSIDKSEAVVVVVVVVVLHSFSSNIDQFGTDLFSMR